METRLACQHVLFQHKAAGIKQLTQVNIAVYHGVNRGAGVDTRQPLAQFLAVACHVGFGQQDTVGVAYLRLGDGELVHLLVSVHRVDQRNHAV